MKALVLRKSLKGRVRGVCEGEVGGGGRCRRRRKRVRERAK